MLLLPLCCVIGFLQPDIPTSFIALKEGVQYKSITFLANESAVLRVADVQLIADGFD